MSSAAVGSSDEAVSVLLAGSFLSAKRLRSPRHPLGLPNLSGVQQARVDQDSKEAYAVVDMVWSLLEVGRSFTLFFIVMQHVTKLIVAIAGVSIATVVTIVIVFLQRG